jgi:general secretion pathway protein A
MYLNFYNLRKPPFHITPDPEFLYLSPSHKEALAAIIYGIEERKGFVAIIGAVGVGKTTILRSYLERAKKQRLKIVYVFNSRLTFEGLLRTVGQELGIQIGGDDVVEMVDRLHKTLIEEYTQGNTVVIVIDEAQNMPIDTLESLRMISNLETSKDKLVQIVLVGQPEFEEELNSERLRQLKQRLAVRATILPLTKSESHEYIKFRLWKAGSPDIILRPASVFTSRALSKIIKKAEGIPRVLNVLCDNALITGFGYQQKPVTGKIVKEIIRDFEGKGRPRRVRQWLASAAALAFVLLLLLGFARSLPLDPALLERVGISVSPGQEKQIGTMRGPQPSENPAAEGNQVQGVPTDRVLQGSLHKGEPHAAAKTATPLVERAPQASFHGDEPIAAAKTVTPSAERGPQAPLHKEEPAAATKTVTSGDTLSQLVRNAYGVAGRAPELKRLLDLVKENNPQIKDADVILPGQQIRFPDPRHGVGQAKREAR